MTIQEGLQLLYDTALGGKKTYHPSYAWTVDYARRLKAHFAGVDLDEFLEPFTRRESPELFEQRKAVTKHVNKSLGAALDRPFSKVARSNYTEVVSFDNDENGQRADLFRKQVLARFSKSGLNGYVFERVRYWSKFDPNAFLVVEFDSTDGRQRARPYPFEVTAEMAVRFMYDVHGDLQYLICRQVEVDGSMGPIRNEVERLTLYQPFQTLVLQQLRKEELDAFLTLPVSTKTVSSDVRDGDILFHDGKAYRVEIPLPHRMEETPAVRIGFVENPEDDGFTCLSIFDAALPWAEKMLKTNSEFDIVMAFLAFPVSIRYEEQCDAPGCSGGKLIHDNSTCISCHGTGWKARPTSAQEEILLPLPRDPSDAFDLTKIMHYTYPPTEAVRLQGEMLQSYFQQAKEAVFNSEMFSKQETAQTATYHGIALQSVYDTLYPYAQNLGRVWEFAAYACKVFTGFPGSLVAGLIFPQDFRFETVSDLFAELKMARESEAGPDTGEVIEDRIMGLMLRDNEEERRRWAVRNMFNPFRGMTETQILAAQAGGLVPRWKLVLWANLSGVMEEAVRQQPDFYLLETTRQREVVRGILDEIMQEIDGERPALNLGSLAGDTSTPVPYEDNIGKIPLGIQQLALAQMRAADAGNTVLAQRISEKIDSLLDNI